MHTLLLPLLLVGCDAFTLVEYEVDGGGSTTIPGTRKPVQLTEADGAELLADSLEDTPDVRDGDLAEAHFSAIDLFGGDADDSLEFLTAVTISVAAPGLPLQELAWSAGPFEGAGPFALALTDVDVAPYLEADDLTLPVLLDGVTPSMDTDVAVGWTLVLGVTPKGAHDAIAAQHGG